MNTEMLPGSCVERMLSGSVASGSGQRVCRSEPTPEEVLRECTSALRLTEGGEGEGDDEDGGGGGGGGGSHAGGPSEKQLAAWQSLMAEAQAVGERHRIELLRQGPLALVTRDEISIQPFSQ